MYSSHQRRRHKFETEKTNIPIAETAAESSLQIDFLGTILNFDAMVRWN